VAEPAEPHPDRPPAEVGRVVWIIRSFLDYRVPVFQALSQALGGELYVLYSGDYVPAGVQAKLQAALGDHALPLHGEWRWGPEDRHTLANSVVSLRYQPGLRRAIRRCRPDVLVCEGFFKWSVAGWACKLLHGTPVVVNYERTAHTERHAQWYRRAYRRTVLRLADAVCCNGRQCADYVAGLGMPPSRITTGHMVADTQGLSTACAAVTPAQRAAQRAAWQAEGTVLLCVGSLSRRKGVEELLRAWAALEQADQPPATLVIVGDGDRADALRAQARQANLQRVHFAGPCPYDAIAATYAAADALIIPTLEDNWSLVVPEAMACGLPVLSSVHNGCWPELVQPANGWVFDPLDTPATAAALRQCIGARDQLPAMGAASRQLVARYSPASAAQAILSACRLARQR